MKTLLIISLLFITGFSFSQNKQCLKGLREGKFTYPGMEDQYIVKRTKDKQIEESLDGKQKIVMKIDWVNDSEYMLVVEEIKNMPGCLKQGDEILVKITNCQSKGYSFASTTKKCGSVDGYIIKLD